MLRPPPLRHPFEQAGEYRPNRCEPGATVTRPIEPA
jgi:hypothetical protein